MPHTLLLTPRTAHKRRVAVLICPMSFLRSMALSTDTTTATRYGSGLASCHKASSLSGKTLVLPCICTPSPGIGLWENSEPLICRTVCRALIP